MSAKHKLSELAYQSAVDSFEKQSRALRKKVDYLRGFPPHPLMPVLAAKKRPFIDPTRIDLFGIFKTIFELSLVLIVVTKFPKYSVLILGIWAGIEGMFGKRNISGHFRFQTFSHAFTGLDDQHLQELWLANVTPHEAVMTDVETGLLKLRDQWRRVESIACLLFTSSLLAIALRADLFALHSTNMYFLLAALALFCVSRFLYLDHVLINTLMGSFALAFMLRLYHVRSGHKGPLSNEENGLTLTTGARWLIIILGAVLLSLQGPIASYLASLEAATVRSWLDVLSVGIAFASCFSILCRYVFVGRMDILLDVPVDYLKEEYAELIQGIEENKAVRA